MPEGGEVKLFGERLAKAVSGKTLTSIDVLTGRYTKKPPEGLHTMTARLPTKVVGVGVHGKFIYWIVHNDVFIYCTLGMTGSWSESEEKHSRVRFQFSDGTKVFFTDPRNFGTLKFVAGRSSLIQKLESLGPDMLSQPVSDALFEDRLRRRPDKTISEVIMDQSVIAGVGNYVKAEALFRSLISPHRTVESLSQADLSRLKRAIQEVILEAYNMGGASIQTYRDFDGRKGEYTRRFRVYNQSEDPNGNPVLRETTLDGRTTHWVPAVQK